MSTYLFDQDFYEPFNSTSAAGSVPKRAPYSLIGGVVAVAGALITPGTSSGRPFNEQDLFYALSQTTTSFGEWTINSREHSEATASDVEAVSVEATRSAIYELRRLSGLTWDQLARLFNVSRRSLHFWASGKPLNSDNQEHLQRLLSVLRKIDRGSAAENRIALLQPNPDGLLPIDLLAGARYDEVVAALGIAPARRKQITLIPLSAEAQAARKPVPPERLTGALHDNVHRDVDTDETIPMSREDREG